MNVIRAYYLDELHKYSEFNLIKVLTGIRRAGKSTIMKLYIDRLLNLGIEQRHIQHYNLDDPKTVKELGEDWNSIFFSIIDKVDEDKTNYIFLDEVQEIEKFEKLLNGLYIQENVNLFVTGSNSKLLSSELATLLTGRSIEIHVLPYSFKEYTLALQTTENIQELFVNHYFLESSLPESVKIRKHGMDAVLNYVDGVYHSILEKDIYPRIKDVNRRMFENVYKFVLANIGSEISPSSIAKALKQDGINVHHKTVSDYLDRLCDSYLLYRAHRFDIRGKQQLATLEKYYVPDLALRYLLVGRSDFVDRGHLLENLVYLELVRRGGQIWIGKINALEVDFVVKKNDGTIEYYQVAYNLNDEKTIQRELASLNAIRDNYPKTILSTDLFEGNENGILLKNVVKWMNEDII